MSHLGWWASKSSYWVGLALWKKTFKDQNDKAQLSFISQCGHRELDRRGVAFYPSLRVVLSPSQSVSIKNPPYLYGEFGECYSSYWLGRKGMQPAWLTGPFGIKSLHLVAEFWYLKPTQWCWQLRDVLLGPSISGKLFAPSVSWKLKAVHP